MQKSWSYYTNFAISTGGDSQLVQGQKILLALKDRLVATGGWTVVGSSDAVDYEYLGVTAGGTYSGSSTGPFDRWESVTDLVRGAEGALHSWCILRKLGTDNIYFVLAYRGASDVEGSFYFHPTKPALGADPLRNLPTITPVVGSMGAFFVYNSTSDIQKGYLCCASDGSFIFATNSSHITDAYTGLVMLHWLEPEEGVEHPFPVVSYLRAATTWTYANSAASFQGWHPEYGNSPVTACTLAYDASTVVLDTMSGVDSVDGKMAAVPTYFFITGDGVGSLLGRAADVYLCPSGLSTRDIAPDLNPASAYQPLTKSLLLDGVDEQVDYGNVVAMSPERTDAHSWNVWIKSTTASNDYIMAKYAVSRGWGLMVDTGGKDFVMRGPRGSTSPMEVWSQNSGGAPDITNGHWHMVTATTAGNDPLTPADIEIYIDGEQMTGAKRAESGSVNETTVSTSSLTVGNAPTSTARFPGNVCHASSWDFALTPAQVTELYGDGVPRDLDALSFASPIWWDTMGDGDAIGAGNMIDLGTGGNNGTTSNVESGDFVSDVPTAYLGTPEWWSFSGIWWFPGNAVPEVGP